MSERTIDLDKLAADLESAGFRAGKHPPHYHGGEKLFSCGVIVYPDGRVKFGQSDIIDSLWVPLDIIRRHIGADPAPRFTETERFDMVCKSCGHPVKDHERGRYGPAICQTIVRTRSGYESDEVCDCRDYVAEPEPAPVIDVEAVMNKVMLYGDERANVIGAGEMAGQREVEEHEQNAAARWNEIRAIIGGDRG